MDNIVQQLKDNEKPFGLMSEEMRKRIRELAPKSVLQFWNNDKWDCAMTPSFKGSTTYRLRADYEDEPEIVEHEIFGVESHLHFHYQGTRHSVCQAYDQPDFIGFKYESGQVELSPIVFKSDCSTKSICQFRDLAALTALHATHVLFRRKRQE